MGCEPSTGAGPSVRQKKSDSERRWRAAETGEQRNQRQAADAAGVSQGSCQRFGTNVFSPSSMTEITSFWLVPWREHCSSSFVKYSRAADRFSELTLRLV
ncbi:hypothetical protein ISCGN_000615 [Ixodes scapularis]